MKIKWIIYGVIAAVIIGFNFCSNNEQPQETVTEEVVSPTQGLITTVKEVEKDQFKIEDEQTIDDVSASLIIAKYMDNTVDTFTLDEARMVADTTNGESNNYRRSSVVRMASYGLMGYFFGRSMGSFRPNRSAYVDQGTYNRVTNNAGQSMQRTASRRTVSRPAGGKSGYGGSSRSTRSYGG
jgi:hypothetical protein